MYKQTIFFSLLISTLLLGCQKSSAPSQPPGNDDWQGAWISIIRKGETESTLPIRSSAAQPVSSADTLTIQISESPADNESFLKSISEFNSLATCFEEDGAAIESPKYQTSVSLKRFEKLEVFSLLPRINQLKTKNNLKCRFIIKIKNTNGSTISWKPIELHIQLDNPQSIVIPIDQIKKTAFTIPNGFTGQPIISCTNYESGFGFSGDDLFYEKTQFAPEEDMRLKHPVQECVFVFQNLADGVLHVSPRYLIDFQMDSQIAVSYQFTPELVPHYPRGENPLYFQMNIVNQGIFPTTLDFGPARNIKLSAEYYYVPPTNVGVAIKNMQPELVMTVSKAYSGTYPNGSNFITLEPGESISVTAHVDLGYFYINTCTILVGGIPAGIYRLLALKLQMTDPVYFHEAVLLSEKNDNSELIRRRELGSDMRSQLQAARMHYWDLARYHQMVAWQSDNVALSCR